MSDYTSEIPYGYCHCGCGQKTNIAKYDNKITGQIKGQPFRYIQRHNMRHNPKQQIEIFWSKVNKDGSIPMHMPHLGKCWQWIGSVNQKWGYGQFATKRLRAHRVAWELIYGEIPNGLNVLHKCDNRLCVNPDHLFLGTTQDNVDDKVSKGRQSKGETIGTHKLTSKEVDEIRQRYAAGGIAQHKLAAEYGVCQTTISDIVIRKHWKD